MVATILQTALKKVRRFVVSTAPALQLSSVRKLVKLGLAVFHKQERAGMVFLR